VRVFLFAVCFLFLFQIYYKRVLPFILSDITLKYSGLAIRFYGSAHSLTVEETEFPEVNAGEALVKIKAAGVCASDIHFFRRTRTPIQVPLILGHEGAGIVKAVGKGVKHVGSGDRVVINYVISCGLCGYCRLGMENLCLHGRGLGFSVNGTFS